MEPLNYLLTIQIKVHTRALLPGVCLLKSVEQSVADFVQLCLTHFQLGKIIKADAHLIRQVCNRVSFDHLFHCFLQAVPQLGKS